MGLEYAVWVPTLAVSHLLGLVLLLYSLEQVGGHVSRLWRRKAEQVEPERKDIDVESQVNKLKRKENIIELTASPSDVEAADLQAPPAANLAWSGICFSVLDTHVMENKTVLSDCVGTACAGETVALMGPSGAGKTTLLDALAGRKGKTGPNFQGRVLLNGKPAGKYLRRYSQYVPQEDAFVATLTTLETIKFRAGLTIPSSCPKTERAARIAAVIEVLGLRKVRDTKVGGLLPGGINVRGLSGGEKRRLSIACALVANPSILFLDEPTTGLDSFAALSVMEHMSQLAMAGHTVVASIHQPRADIFNRFNKVVILSEGHQLYAGPPSQCVSWFQDCLHYNYNEKTDGAVSDWIMDTISVGFKKPAAMASRSMTTIENVQKAAELFGTSYAAQALKPLAMQPVDSSPIKTPRPRSAQNTPRKSQNASDTARDHHSIQSNWKPVLASATDSSPNSNPNGSKFKIEIPADTDNPAVNPEDLQSCHDTVSEASPRLELPGQYIRHHWASKRYAASWMRQFQFLVRRAFLSQLRNPTDTSSRLLMSTWVGLLAGLVFAKLPEGAGSTQQRLALQFFMLLLFQLMPFCFMSFFVADRRFYQADVAAGLYAPSAYYVAAVTASTPAIVINSVCGGLMAFGLAGLRYTGYAIVMYLVILGLQALISHQVQIFCVWLTPNQDMAYTLATGYVASSILLSGFYLRISAIKYAFCRGLSWLSYTKYAMQAMGRIELLGRVWSPDTCTFTKDPITGAQTGSCITKGQEMLDYYGYTINTAVLVGALLTAYIILHIGSYLALSRLHKSY